MGKASTKENKCIYQLAREGKKASEIAEILGIGKSTVEHNEGWKNRNKKEFVF